MYRFSKIIFYLTFMSGSLAVDYSVTSIPHSDCPPIDDINHAVMLPYPQDCTKYYSCLKGNAYVQQCPNNMHWSTITYRCDYPDVAKCEITFPPTPQNTISGPVVNVLTPSLTGDIVYQIHSNDCAKYYKCQVLACPTNYYWNSVMQKCDFPHNAQCPFLQGVSNTVQPVANFPLHTEHHTEETYTLHYPNDCSKFYQCQSMLCPENYHWNDRLQQCDIPVLAKCPLQPQLPQLPEITTSAVPTAFTAPPTPVVTTQSIESSSAECLECAQRCDGYLHHYLPHPYDCHKFIQCNGWSFIHTCPDNLFWNAKLNTCDRMCVTN